MWYLWKARNDTRFQRKSWTPWQAHHVMAAHISTQQAVQETQPRGTDSLPTSSMNRDMQQSTANTTGCPAPTQHPTQISIGLTTGLEPVPISMAPPTDWGRHTVTTTTIYMINEIAGTNPTTATAEAHNLEQPSVPHGATDEQHQQLGSQTDRELAEGDIGVRATTPSKLDNNSLNTPNQGIYSTDAGIDGTHSTTQEEYMTHTELQTSCLPFLPSNI